MADSKKAEIEGAEPMASDAPLVIEGAAVAPAEPDVESDDETTEDAEEAPSRPLTLKEKKALANAADDRLKGTKHVPIAVPTRDEMAKTDAAFAARKR